MKKTRKIIIIILSIVIITLSIFIYFNKYEEDKYVELNKKIVKEIKADSASKKDNKKILDRYRREFNNDDIVGQISIENSDFSMLFAKAQDNDYYLTHLINKESNKLGATFIDYRNDIDKSKKINIYGHNNNNAGLSFNYIMNYENKEFYENHKRIIISSDLKDYIYEIFSIQIVDNSSDYIHMKLDFTDEEWIDYINNVLDNSLYKEDIDINKINKILTLQTCTNRIDWQFLLVNARLVE